MTSKKEADEILPPGAVPVESVFGFKDFDRFAGIPEIEPFVPPTPGDGDEKKPARAEKSTEKKDG